MNRPVIWEPTPRQADFLAAAEDEVLFGGAAGGGKTDGLVIDALGAPWKAVEQPEYRALCLRRTFPELKEVIDRTNAIYPLAYPGAKWSIKDGEWRFPSGARIELGYLDRDSDVGRYQSRQFQWIGWEELAQWPTSYPYEYMLSRLRAPERLRLPCFVRATCNPDGQGARWIAKRFKILPSGQSTYAEEKIGDRIWRRRFIASRLEDNPHLAGTGYKEKLMMLPDEIRRALYEGRWDEPQIGGAIYVESLRQAQREGRITKVPYDPTCLVDTWWDLGMADSTVIWFTQDVGREIHVIDYFEASGEGFPYYAKILREKPYAYGRHTAPADIAVRELGTGRSRLEVAANLGIKFDREGMPQIGLEEGIHATRMLFPRLWFDEKKCHAGLEALAHYRRDYNQRLGEYKASPVHDWASHGADGLRTLGVSHKVTIMRTEDREERRVFTISDGQGYDSSSDWLGN